jgi:acetyl-CoA carboxylase biotin carboxyl carrier protein
LAHEVEPAFLSYSRSDSAFALRLAADLKAGGANVWLDQTDIEPGKRWDREIEQALRNCSCVLVIMSPSSVDLENVRDEVSFALSKNKKIIPILYEQCDIPYRLERLQRVDFGSGYSQAVQMLLRNLALEKLVDPVALAAKQERLKQLQQYQDSDLYIVKSPIVGTFYESPSPNSPPFVEIGDLVREGQVVCVIEAMKLLNEIESDVSGLLVKTLISNAEQVEYGTPLFGIFQKTEDDLSSNDER